MAVHVVPVGLSLTGNLTRRHGLPEPPSLPLPAALTPGTPESARLTEAVAELRPRDFTAEYSAELTTLDRYHGESGAALPATRRFPERDAVVLLSSDTPAGHRDALWNALALTQAETTWVRYAPEPSGAEKLRAGEVLVLGVPGLDTAGRAPFTEAMIHLGRLGRGLLASSAGRGADYVFHLSGGYKATIPYLLGLAEGMLGLRDREELSSVRADVLHEADRSRLIDIPLRALPYRMVLRELGSARRDPTNGGYTVPYDPDHRLLEGYAYRRAGEEYRLTPFGEGLLRLADLAGAE